MQKTIVLCGGGTAGHVMPNLALLPELEKRFDRIFYVGEKGGVCERLAKAAGVDFYGVKCVKFSRNRPLKNLAIPFVLKEGIDESERVLKLLAPSVLFAKGGYVSLPPAFAAKRLGIPYAIHESDMSLGLANKLLAKGAEAVFTSFKGTYKGEIVSGNPIRDVIFEGERGRAPRFSDTKPILLVVGGSSGATAINKAIVNALPYLHAFNVIHVCGKNKDVDIQNVHSSNYCVLEYSSHIEDLYAAADIVITRAGANALSELTALGKRIIAIPLPKGASRGDQGDNAEYYRLKGLIDVIPQNELDTDKLLSAINSALRRKERTPEKGNANEMIAQKLYEIAKQ